MKKITSGLMLLLVFSLFFTGCDLLGSSFDASDYIKGGLDSIYLGVHSKDYVDMVIDSEADLKATYEEGLRVEADFFMQYFDIEADYIPESMVNEIINLLREIYTHSRYTVGEAVKSGDNHLVSVTIYPIDIIQKVIENDFNPFLEEWYEMGSRGEFDEMSPEEFESLWARNIIDMTKRHVNSIGHLEPTTISVQVELNRVGGRDIFSVNDADLARIDSFIIAY